MKDREFILALKTQCRQYVESFDKISAIDDGIGGYTAVGSSTAYWAVVKMIDAYLEELNNND